MLSGLSEEGRRVAVLLMDTQGAWDDTMTKAQSATIFGLTALLSSKLPLGRRADEGVGRGFTTSRTEWRRTRPAK